MSLEAAYLEAALPEPFTILGQELQAYSLGHQMLLARNRNSFVTGERLSPETVIEDLLMGVFICCHTFEEASMAIRRRDLPKVAAEWRKKLEPGDELAKILSFQEYLAAGSQSPKWKTLRRGRNAGSPFLLTLLRFLTNHFGLSLSQALNFPYGHGRWLYAAHWEMEGAIRISEESDEELIRRVEAEAAKYGLQLMKVSRN